MSRDEFVRLIGASERPAYCASKGGVGMLAKVIAIDHADDNIRTNAILPGPIETPRLLQHRLGQPDEVAKAALYLASDESTFTSGADFFVDGDYTAI